jgi:competence ComEA-like helix-hairpin-helix protein
MRTLRTRLLIALPLCAIALGSGVDADAAAPARGVLSISPARRDVTARPPLSLAPTEVKNTTEVDMVVKTFPVLLFQKLDGTFGFNESPRELNAAKLQLGVGPAQFRLAPQQAREVSLRWLLLPRKARAAYLGMVVQGTPELGGKKQVGSVLRLLSVNFLTLPGHWTVDGKLTGVHGEQAGPRVLRFLPRVRNTGQIHSQPRAGRCTIEDAGGAVRVRSRFGSGIVLPGYEREYPIVVRKLLPAGSYRMTCSMKFGKARSTRVLPFKLSGPNTLPTPNLKLTSVGGSGEVGATAKAQVVFRNRGSAPARGILRVTLKSVATDAPPKVVGSGRFPQGTLKGGASKSVDLEVGPDLKAGTYAADVVLSDGREDVDERTASFTATKHKGFASKVWDWLVDHFAWLVALLALAGLLILFLLYRRRKREMDEELAAARAGVVPDPYGAPLPAFAPEPAAVPALVLPPQTPPAGEAVLDDGRVNLNTASAEELMTLPGVGRRAAERILAQREAGGPFTSLQDLGAIEGFHAERIERLAESAEV